MVVNQDPLECCRGVGGDVGVGVVVGVGVGHGLTSKTIGRITNYWTK